MGNCIPRLSPLLAGHTLVGADESELLAPEAAAWYRTGVGKVGYLLKTKPELCFAFSELSRHLINAGQPHLEHLIGYVAKNHNTGFTVCRDDLPLRVTAYSDSNYAANIDDRKSVSGKFLFVGRTPVVFGTSRQTTLATSSTATFRADHLQAAARHGLQPGSVQQRGLVRQHADQRDSAARDRHLDRRAPVNLVGLAGLQAAGLASADWNGNELRWHFSRGQVSDKTDRDFTINNAAHGRDSRPPRPRHHAGAVHGACACDRACRCSACCSCACRARRNDTRHASRGSRSPGAHQCPQARQDRRHRPGPVSRAPQPARPRHVQVHRLRRRQAASRASTIGPPRPSREKVRDPLHGRRHRAATTVAPSAPLPDRLRRRYGRRADFRPAIDRRQLHSARRVGARVAEQHLDTADHPDGPGIVLVWRQLPGATHQVGLAPDLVTAVRAQPRRARRAHEPPPARPRATRALQCQPQRSFLGRGIGKRGVAHLPTGHYAPCRRPS